MIKYYLLLILFIGIIAGVYLVQHRQNLQSKAASSSPDYARGNLLTKELAPVDKYGDFIVLKSPRFTVEYQAPFDRFMLVILDTPIEEVREEAEKDILAQAGGNLQSLCSLNFSILAPNFVTGKENATDDKLGICKDQPFHINYEAKNVPPSIIDRIVNMFLVFISSFQAQAKKEPFLSDKPIITTQDFPNGVYITLCRNDGTFTEGVWQVGNNPKVTDFRYNQEQTRCSDPVPDYLVFTQSVPVGSYLTLCIPDEQSSNPQEWVWQVNESGNVADFLYSQDGCSSQPPLPQLTRAKFFSFSASSVCSLGTGFCSTEFLKPFFGENVESASKICNKESGGSISIISPTGDVGLFQINLGSHRGSVEYWQNVENNIKKAVAMSGDGSNWRSWSAAYQHACFNNKKIQGCGFIEGQPPWQNAC